MALLGFGAAALAVLGFGGLVDAVSENADVASYDPGLATSVVHLRGPGLTFAAEVVSTVGSEAAVGVLTALAMAWLWFGRRDRARAAIFGVTMVVAAGLTLLVKHLLARHRPPAALVVGPVDTGYSFPSGHTVFSTVFLGLVAMLVVWPRISGPATRARRIGAVAACVLGSVTIGATRVYLGYHWTTDVVAGWVLAVAVLAVALVVSTMVRTRHGSSGPWVEADGATDDEVEGVGHACPAG